MLFVRLLYRDYRHTECSHECIICRHSECSHECIIEVVRSVRGCRYSQVLLSASTGRRHQEAWYGGGAYGSSCSGDSSGRSLRRHDALLQRIDHRSLAHGASHHAVQLPHSENSSCKHFGRILLDAGRAERSSGLEALHRQLCQLRIDPPHRIRQEQ